VSTRPRLDNSKGQIFRRLLDVDASATDRAKHVVLADRFVAQPQASGVFRDMHTFLRDQLRAALAIPIAVVADDLAVQGPVLEAIDRAIAGLADEPLTQRDFLLSFLAVAGVDALASPAAFRSGVIRYAAACAENLMWDESSELPRGLPGEERWFKRPRKTFDVMLHPEERRDLLRRAYYELRSSRVEVITALRALFDRLRGEPLGTMTDASFGGPLDQVVRYLVSSASELWGPSFTSYRPPELTESARHDVENVVSALVLPRDATSDVLYTRCIWSSASGGTPKVLMMGPRPEIQSAPVSIRVPIPIVLDDPARVPRRLTRAYVKRMHESLVEQFRAAEQSAAARGRRIAGPRRRHDTDMDQLKLIARRLDLRAAGLGATKIARAEAAETGGQPPPRTVRHSITSAARELGIGKLPAVPAQKWRTRAPKG
jgi:hypothetical protein